MGTKKTHWSYGLVIVLIAFIQYSNTLGHDFAWDDKIVIQENDRVQEGFSGIPELFKKHTSDLRKDQYGYRPITLLTFAIDYELSSGEPAFFHFMNIIYFAIVCLVLFLVMKRVFHSYSPMLPFLIVALFAVHPIHVEVVANVKSRDEILALLFCLISLLHLLKYLDKNHWKYILYTILFFGIGFLSKENAITFIPIYIIALVASSNFTWKRMLKIAALLVPISLLIAYVVSSYALNSELGKSETVDLGIYQENPILGNAFFYVDHFINKIGNACYLILLYLKDFIAPFNLAYYHGYGDLEPVGVSWQSILGFILSVSAFIFAIIRFKKFPIISYGILFFFFTISIYLHVVRTLADTRADRFLFFASVGLSIVLIGVLLKLLKLDLHATEKSFDLPLLKSLKEYQLSHKLIFVAVLLFFSIVTFSRNGVWKNDFTLVENDMERLESSARPHYYFATNLLLDIQQNGLTAEKEERMIHHYRRSMELSDSIYYGRIELGGYLCDQGRIEEGAAVFQETVDLFPTASDPRHYLGKAFVQLEKYEESIEHLEKSIEYAPKIGDSYYLLAISYAKTGKGEQGLELIKKGFVKFPEAKQSLYEALGHIYFEMNDMEKSTENTLKMIDFGADPFRVYATIIGRYQAMGDKESADKYYQSAVQQGIMQVQR